MNTEQHIMQGEVSLREQHAPLDLAHLVDRGYDLCLALVLLPIAIIILLPCYMVHRFYNRRRGSFLYSGDRLGKNRKLFKIYKIRTLVEDAESRLGSKLAEDSDNLELKLGRFFRATRIDELPQIFNILKGDMGFVGPRPERVSVYDQKCKVIKDYDVRFKIRPGLVGYSQIFTPHSAPKRLRAIIDRCYTNKRISCMQKSRLVVWTMILVFRKTMKETLKRLSWRACMLARARRIPKERRSLQRIAGKNVRARVTDGWNTNWSSQNVIVWNLNAKALKVETDLDLDPGDQLQLMLTIKASKGKFKRAYCRGTIYKKSTTRYEADERHTYIVFYQPQSEYSRYVIDHYLFMQTVSKAG